MSIAILERLINKKGKIELEEAEPLEDIIKNYPYFQLAGALYLKALRNRNTTKFNDYIHSIAVNTTNRETLYSFIENLDIYNDNDKKEDDYVPEQLQTLQEKTEQLIKEEIESDEKIIDDIIKKKEDVYRVGRLIQENFDKMRLTKDMNSKSIFKEISERKNPSITTKNTKEAKNETLKIKDIRFSTEDIENLSTPKTNTKHTDKEITTNKKIKEIKEELIETFLNKKPKIIPTSTKEDNTEPINIAKQRNKANDISELMTETLANMYVKQRKYDQAIQAYKILILKNPEKSTYFADKIKSVRLKKIQNL